MKTKLFKTKIFAFIVIFIEMAALAFFGICYGLDLLGFRNIFNTELIFLILGAVVIFDIVFCWALIFRFSRIRQQSDLRAADLIGSDIQEAYNFGMIGLIVINRENKVVWVNDLFKERQIDILDENIEGEICIKGLFNTSYFNDDLTTKKVTQNQDKYTIHLQ